MHLSQLGLVMSWPAFVLLMLLWRLNTILLKRKHSPFSLLTIMCEGYTFFKVINGGHTWSGAIPIPVFGNTNQDINQSEIIGEFFSELCSKSTGINETPSENSISVYPNPFISQLTINTNNYEELTMIIYNNLLQPIIKKTFEKTVTINTDHFPGGIYYYEVRGEKGLLNSGKVIKN